jgi:hypothetical protein
MDHLGDPILMADGRVRLGVEGCKRMLRAGIKRKHIEGRDNLVLAIGGKTARDGLRDRLSWAGIAVQRHPDASIDFEGFYLGEAGPLAWRQKFPLAAKYVDTVSQGHRNKDIPADVRDEFIRMFEWGKRIAAKMPVAESSMPATGSRCRRRRCPPSRCTRR